MIELSIDSFPMEKEKRIKALKFRENAIIEFSNGEEGYIIEALPGGIYGFVYFHRNGLVRKGSRSASLYSVLDFAILDSEDSYDDLDGFEWLRDLKVAEKRLLGLTGEFDIETIKKELIEQFPPKRAAFGLEESSDTERPQKIDSAVQNDAEASIARQGTIIDRLNGRDLTYLVQRTDLNLFRFVVLEPGKDPRYGGTQTTELRQVYDFIDRDAKANYSKLRWWPMEDDLCAFLGRSEEEAESYLVLKKLYRQLPELDHDGRDFNEVMAIAKGIAEIFGK